MNEKFCKRTSVNVKTNSIQNTLTHTQILITCPYHVFACIFGLLEEEEEEEEGRVVMVGWEFWWFSWLVKCVGFVVVWFGCGEKDWWLYSVALPIGKFSFCILHPTNTHTHTGKTSRFIIKKISVVPSSLEKGKTLIVNKSKRKTQFSMVVPCCDLCLENKYILRFILNTLGELKA